MFRCCPRGVAFAVLFAFTGGCGGAVPDPTERTAPTVTTEADREAAANAPRPEDVPDPGPVEVGLAGQAEPDVVRYLMVRRASAPSLSPDGAQLAFHTSITGQPHLWVVNARGGWPAQRTFGRAITFSAWSPAGDWIAYGADREGNERPGFYVISPDGTRERELLPPSEAFREFGGFSRDGRRIAYATTERNGEDFDIHVLDVATGEDREVFRGRMGLYVAAWRPDGGALVLTESRGEDGNDLFLLDLGSGELEPLFTPDDPNRYDSVAWKPDGSGFYLATNHDRDFAGVAFVDAGTRDLEWVATPEKDVDQVRLSHDGRLLAWTENDGGWSTLRVRDLAARRDIAPPAGLPRGVYAIDFADGSDVLAVEVDGPRIPGDIWTWRVRERGEAALARATSSTLAGLDPEQLVLPEHLDFEASDGETLHGLLYLPPGATQGEPPPVLLNVHGGPTAQARPRFNPVHQYLLAQGVAVFDLNFRGSTGYGKRFTRLDNLRLRPNTVRDMADAIDFLGRDGRVDASRAAVMGGSYGGYMAFAALAQHPDRFRGGVSFVGVSNWVTALEGASPQLKASDRLEYGDIDDPEDREFFRQLSPITHVDNVRAPLLVSHGANDPRDPPTESDLFVRAVRDRGGEVEYLRFADEGHGIRKLDNRVHAYRRVAAFLERVLGTRSPPSTNRNH